jgi:WD40 repeat protein
MRLAITLLFLISVTSVSLSQSVETIVQKGHIQPISIIEWHPSGDYFVTGSTDHSIILWDYHSGKQIRTFNQHTGKILDLKFSSDGNLLLSSSLDNTVTIVNCSNGELIFRHNYKEQNAYPMSVDFSPLEDYVFIGDNRDNFAQVSIEDKSIDKISKGFSARINRSSWSENQTFAFEVENYKGGQLINRIAKDTTFIEFDKPNDYIFNGELLAVSSNKLKAAIFKTTDGSLVREFEAENKCDGCKMKIAFSKDGDLFATFAREEGLKVYKIGNWKLVSHIKSISEANAIKFSQNNQWISVKDDEEYTHVKLSSKQTFKTPDSDKDQPKSGLHPSLPIQLISNDLFGIKAVNTTNGKVKHTFSGLLNDKKQQVESLNYSSWYSQNIINHLKLQPSAAINNDGTLLAIGKVDTSVVIQDLEKGSFLPQFIHHSSPIFSITFHPKESLILTGDAEGNMKLWNYETRKLVWEFRPHVRYIFSAAFNEKGDQLITSSWDGIVKHWRTRNINVETPKLIDAIDFKNNTGFVVDFSPRDLYLAIGDVEKNMRLYEADTKEYLNKFRGHSRTISDFCFFEVDGDQRIATVSRDGWLKIWDFNTGTLLDKFSNDQKTAMLSITHVSEKNLLILGNTNRMIYGYNYKDRIKQLGIIAHSSGVNWVKWNKERNELISRSTNGEIEFWKLYEDSIELQHTLHVIDKDEWILMSPNGFFDGTAKAMQYINYVQGFKSLEIDLFFDKYYTPKLFEQLNSEQKGLQDRGLNQMMKDVPSFELKMKSFQDELITVQPDSMYNHNSNKLQLSVDYSNSSSDLKSVAIFNNNKRTATLDFKSNPIFRGVRKTKEFEVELVPGENELRLELITDDNLRSPSKTISVKYDTLLGRRELFIVALGINKYENPSYDLNYAKADAQSFVKQLSENAAQLFEEIHTLSLYNKEVNKQGVMKSINEFKKNMGPEDVFVFYYAGHGVMIPQPKTNESSFFLVMNDITNMYGEFEAVSSKGLSGNELFQIAKDISAQKQLFIIDACQSGGALKAGNFRGVEREKAIAKLARSSGTFFITASQEMEYANESSDLKHGVFTYAILELMSSNNELTQLFSSDAIISASELKAYVESRVPELSKKYKGSPQYPTGYSFGNDFPIVESK